MLFVLVLYDLSLARYYSFVILETLFYIITSDASFSASISCFTLRVPFTICHVSFFRSAATSTAAWPRSWTTQTSLFFPAMRTVSPAQGILGNATTTRYCLKDAYKFLHFCFDALALEINYFFYKMYQNKDNDILDKNLEGNTTHQS